MHLLVAFTTVWLTWLARSISVKPAGSCLLVKCKCASFFFITSVNQMLYRWKYLILFYSITTLNNDCDELWEWFSLDIKQSWSFLVNFSHLALSDAKFPLAHWWGDSIVWLISCFTGSIHLNYLLQCGMPHQQRGVTLHIFFFAAPSCYMSYSALTASCKQYTGYTGYI